MSLKIKIDATGIANTFKEFAAVVEKEIKNSAAELAVITHAKAQEMAQAELDTSRKDYLDALGFEEVSPGVWVITLEEGAMWIEEGIPQNFDMKPGLLRDGETSPSGKRYRVVPFEHTKTPTQMTQKASSIVGQLRAQLKKQNIPFKSIERDSNGSARTGKLHALNLKSDVPGNGNTPALKGVSIYQTVTKTGNVRRDILTFRTVTGEQTGKWLHPGFAKKKFLDRSFDWALKEWETKILPEILDKWK